jgi:hypothetical protein
MLYGIPEANFFRKEAPRACVQALWKEPCLAATLVLSSEEQQRSANLTGVL